MAAIAASDLRNHLAEVLRRVAAGEEFEVVHDDQPVAMLIPVHRTRRWIPASELIPDLVRLGPDVSGLCDELAVTIGETTSKIS